MVGSQTLAYQVPGGQGERQVGGPDQARPADLVVGGEGDVSTQHVVQEDSQGPHRELVRLVFPRQDPLRRTVDTSTAKLLKYFVWFFMIVVFTPGTEVNQLDVVGLHVHENVLVLDVPVEDPGVSALDHSLDNLTKHSTGKVLR